MTNRERYIDEYEDLLSSANLSGATHLGSLHRSAMAANPHALRHGRLMDVLNSNTTQTNDLGRASQGTGRRLTQCAECWNGAGRSSRHHPRLPLARLNARKLGDPGT